jgi:hypothetical protein
MDLLPHQIRGFEAPVAKTRLVTPRPEPTPSPTPLKPSDAQAVDTGTDQGGTDLLIQGLLDRLPTPNGVWSLDERAKWLRTAAAIFGLVYKTIDGEQREIGVVLLQQNAGNSPAAEAVAPGFIGQGNQDANPVASWHGGRSPL